MSLKNGVKIGQQGPNGVWGKGAPKGPRPKKAEPALTLKQVERVFADKLKMRDDWAAEIAHACFVGNREAIYESFSRRLIMGDSRAFNALANRAYGLPRQELAFSQDKPFKLVIEYIGERVPETITIDPPLEAAPQLLALAPPAEPPEIAENCSD